MFENIKKILKKLILRMIFLMVFIFFGSAYQIKADSTGWVAPTGYVDVDSAWSVESNSYDNIFTSSASSLGVPAETWSSFLEFDFPTAQYDKIAYYIDYSGAIPKSNRMVDIDLFYDGDWHDEYQGEYVEWNSGIGMRQDISVGAGKSISKARFRLYQIGLDTPYFIYEVNLGVAPYPGPTVATIDATNKQITTAILNGSISSCGRELCDYRFRYKKLGGTYSYTSWVYDEFLDVNTQLKGDGNSFAQNISGLDAGSTYYYNAEAKNLSGVEGDWGTEKTFTTYSSAETLRPGAAGSETNLTIGGDSPAPTNWESVSEEVADDSATIVSVDINDVWKDDFYALDDNVNGSGIVNGVVIYARGIFYTSSPLQLCLKTHGTVYCSAETASVSDDFDNIYYELTTNPFTNNSWTWDEVNNLEVGSNLFWGAGRGSGAQITQIYAVAYSTPFSTDATLSNLAISSGTLSPTFASGTNSYTVSVANSVTSVTITPTVNQADATVTVNGTTVASNTTSDSIPLSVGPNTITIVVTAQDGTTTDTYTITVTRAGSGDATLSDLIISQGTLIPAFASGTTSYTARVSHGTSDITITPTVSQANATITVNAITVASGVASDPIALSVG